MPNDFGRPIEILLVEDDLADIKLTQRALAHERVLNNITAARDGVEALRFLRRQGEHANAVRPDLILLDLNMPRMDGRQTLREIKSDPELQAIPVVIITTSDDEGDIRHSYMEHANSYITKPVNIEQFKKAIFSVRDYWFSVVKLPPPSEDEENPAAYESHADVS